MSATAKKKARSKKDSTIDFLTDVARNNVVAMKEGPVKKQWSIHDLKTVKPITTPQKMMFESFFSGNHIIANGYAGTGKTFIAAYLALTNVLSKEQPQEKIIIVRSAVPSRDIGFLPGTAEEKMEPYELPYKEIFSELVRYNHSYDTMKDTGHVSFMPTSFVRGLTWDNAVIIVDEMQNMTDSEINSVMTRVGNNSKVIVCGDNEQNDLTMKRNEQSGFQYFLKIADRMRMFDQITFGENDIVRSGFVKEWILARQG